MAKNIEVKCNFPTVFAKYDNIEELKAIANSICGQVKEAYDARLAEIKSGNTGVIVEVVDITAATPQPKKKVNTSHFRVLEPDGDKWLVSLSMWEHDESQFEAHRRTEAITNKNFVVGIRQRTPPIMRKPHKFYFINFND